MTWDSRRWKWGCRAEVMPRFEDVVTRVWESKVEESWGRVWKSTEGPRWVIYLWYCSLVASELRGKSLSNAPRREALAPWVAPPGSLTPLSDLGRIRELDGGLALRITANIGTHSQCQVRDNTALTGFGPSTRVEDAEDRGMSVDVSGDGKTSGCEGSRVVRCSGPACMS
jgi:hypothetical protein